MKFPRPPNKKKNGVSTSFPDVCRIPPPPAPFAPTPYPNVTTASVELAKASKKVKVLQREMLKSKPGTSSGDEAGSQKAIVSSMNQISHLFIQHSMKVKVEGKKASLMTDIQQSNRAFTNAAKLQKSFEGKLMQQTKKLMDACKGDAEKQRAAQRAVEQIAKAARGHPI